jgi:hypothetical protein
VYVAETLGKRMLVYRREGDRGLVLTRSFAADVCDNIDVDAATGDVLVACHPKPLTFQLHAQSEQHARDAPSEVLWTTRARMDATPDGENPFVSVFVDDGSTLSGSSVAASAGGGRVLIGAVVSVDVRVVTVRSLYPLAPLSVRYRRCLAARAALPAPPPSCRDALRRLPRAVSRSIPGLRPPGIDARRRATGQ